MPPPTGTSTIADFKILSHVNLKILKKSKSSQEIDSEYEEPTNYKISLPEELAPAWLRLVPSSESYFLEISNSLDEGMETLQYFERWSKHPDMKIYMDVLEEWDDKISDDLLVNDYSLHPDEWIDVNDNENKKNSIKTIVD